MVAHCHQGLGKTEDDMRRFIRRKDVKLLAGVVKLYIALDRKPDGPLLLTQDAMGLISGAARSKHSQAFPIPLIDTLLRVSGVKC